MNRFFITVLALCLWCLLGFGCAASSQEDPAYSTYPAHRGQAGPYPHRTAAPMPHTTMPMVQGPMTQEAVNQESVYQGPMNQESMHQGPMAHDRGDAPYEGLAPPYEETPMPREEGYRAQQRHLSRGDAVAYPEGHMMDYGQGLGQSGGQTGGLAGEQSGGQASRMREIEQERRFMQDQESRTRDFRRAFPHEPAPRQDAYRSYEGSRPPPTL